MLPPGRAMGPGAEQGLVEEILLVTGGRLLTVDILRRVRLNWLQVVSALRQSSGISESTLMRARASSLRLVSWVEVAIMAWG